ncbi:MAG TPA: histidine kinase [Ramlibacter sp.]|nr:histidine kinase [Ramlibacter sp.]
MKPSPALPASAGTAFDWGGKLRHLLLIVVFCLAVALAYVAFLPEHAFVQSLAYSLPIGLTSWLLIDFGRHAFPSAAETGWPRGPQGLLLVAGGLLLGYLVGQFVGDTVARHAGWPAAGGDPATRMRNTLLVSAIAGIVGSYYFYAQSRSAYLQRKMVEAQRHAEDARLKLLESQLEPHMLFNTLANLRALIALDPPRAQQMLDHMIAYLRATLDASRGTTHALQAEFERLRDYLALMAIRMGPRLSFTLELPPDCAGLAVPTLLLQPLVENSIQHGLEPKVEGGRIVVRAWRNQAQLELEVRDTGVGASAQPPSGRGFGLAQVRERLAALYGPAARLTFESSPGAGACVRVTLPLEP